jgi:DNA-directed RNA polymerase
MKLNQAKKFRDFEELFFPYNVDFRGRAYPVTPHLSIVGSDLCRALLTFARPKPLGPNGLKWLKVHLANLAGNDKMSFDGRAQFTDDNMDNIRSTVNDPFGENKWWMKLDDPFQGLATCYEIVHAIDSGDPENYLCSLPVHMVRAQNTVSKCSIAYYEPYHLMLYYTGWIMQWIATLRGARKR